MSNETLTIQPTGAISPIAPAIPALSIRHIVVGYQDDASGNKALCVAEQVAEHFGAQLTFTHAITPPPASDGVCYEELKEEFLEDAKKRTGEAIRLHLHDQNRELTEVIAFESAAGLLLHTARQKNADLVVVGSHGKTGLDQLLFGSVSEAIGLHCPCPVLVCGTECDPTATHRKAVLLASTPTHMNIRAAEYAGAIAQHTGAKLIAMQLVGRHPAPEAHERLWQEDNARDSLRVALGEVAMTTTGTAYCMRYGDLATETIALADEEDVALIVVGSPKDIVGEGHFAPRMLGHILKDAECPVLIISDIAK